MTSKNEQHTIRRGWRARLGIGLLAATALTGVVAEMAPASAATASVVIVQSRCGSSWT